MQNPKIILKTCILHHINNEMPKKELDLVNKCSKHNYNEWFIILHHKWFKCFNDKNVNIN